MLVRLFVACGWLGPHPANSTCNECAALRQDPGTIVERTICVRIALLRRSHVNALPATRVLELLVAVSQADLAQVPVQRPSFQETTSLGAALAAGLAAGVYDHDHLFGTDSEAPMDVFEPKMDSAQAQAKHTSWRIAVEKSFGLAELT